MTDKTSPATAGTPTFRQWLRSDRMQAFPLAMMIIASFVYAASIVAAFAAGISLVPAVFVTAPIVILFVVVSALALRSAYRRQTASTRAGRLGSSLSSGTRSTYATRGPITSPGSGDNSYVAPVLISAIEDSHSDRGHTGHHSDHGGYSHHHSGGHHSDFGGYSDAGGYSGGDSGGGDSGGGGCD